MILYFCDEYYFKCPTNVFCIKGREKGGSPEDCNKKHGF